MNMHALRRVHTYRLGRSLALAVPAPTRLLTTAVAPSADQSGPRRTPTLPTTQVNINTEDIAGGRLPPTISRILSPQSSAKFLNRQNAVTIVGWLKSIRTQKQHTFLHVQDGTHPDGIQIVVTGDHSALPAGLSTGCALRITNGTLQPSPEGVKQPFEVHLPPSSTDSPQQGCISLLSPSDLSYPLQKKRHSLDFLRTITHLRPRSNLMSAVQRTRHATQVALHQWFHAHDFVHIHTPILTASDCEGAGETFSVTGPPASKPGDPAFFGGSKHAVHLTVSGQLHLEMFAAAHPRVYTLSPAFRAEKSLSTRHLAEFYMLEAEMAFIESLDPLIDVTGKLVQACARAVSDADVVQVAEILAMQAGERGEDKRARVRAAEARVARLAEGMVERVTYSDAVRYLQGHKRAKKFVYPVVWGNDLQAEHEAVLADDVGGPVCVTDYPAQLKPFYMLPNQPSGEHGQTAACFDMLVPGVGELVGGSLREHDPEKLAAAMRARGMDPEGEDYRWYVELRKYGMGPHGGFGLGFDRLVRHLLGIDSVREVVPVPRYYTECRY
ncbi:hypothetical protein BCR44DRAFT_41647 [Catenaria anguillulae PL171]|uniref:asparagine--tRNA ligase n=1 Tax=Catenaria anguillulae PL171 TaxID=765915 RepID=A0A1Y2HIQ3_9FUNG|nr:hypothetical protein BCR44DRAFT_41647 [Catenaria anguillulae PL171]